jgi:hypothetical protein
VASTPCATGNYCAVQPNDPAACIDACTAADASTADLGCNFWGVVTSNSNINSAFTGDSVNGSPGTLPSQFAFVVTNPTPTVANVTVETDSLPPINTTVNPGDSQTIFVPWRMICGSGEANFGYNISSNLPVRAYQFNPLPSSLQTSTTCSSATDCPGYASGDQCVNGQCVTYSFSNDASLLLPTHLLGTAYVVISTDEISERDSLGGGDIPLPASMTVVATTNNTLVHIDFAGSTDPTSVNTSLCPTTQGNLPGFTAQSGQDFPMSAGQVLQFFASMSGTPTCVNSLRGNGTQACDWPNDLTGSVITSRPAFDGGTAQPIAVFGGADCTYKPFNQVACDHIEEEMFPYRNWGTTHVGVKSAAYAGSTSVYPDFWRLVSGCGPSRCPNGTTVTITPAPAGVRANQAVCTPGTGMTTCVLPPLTSGQPAPWVEFSQNGSFVTQSDKPTMLAQYFVSESEAGSASTVTEGDPSLVMTPPVEGWRTDYTVLAPPTYVHNFVNLMVEDSQATSSVQVDGVAVPASDWAQVPGSNYYAAVYSLCGSASANCTGVHTLHSSSPMGAVLYGYDSYVSYGYTGGVNLLPLNFDTPGQ